MTLGIDQAFNSTGEAGMWISNATTNFTGDLGLSLLLLIGALLLMMAILKMPQLLFVIAIFPLIIILGTINVTLGSVLGIIIAIAGISLFTIWFIK